VEKAKKKKTLTVRDPAAFQLYIFRVMKELKPNHTISRKAIALINQIIGDQFEKLMDESRRLTIYNKKATL
jgi:histone H2B